MTNEDGASRVQRLDRWLWYSRIVKSRTRASQLVSDGKVRVNRRKSTKPARCVAPGDVVAVILHGRVRVLEVLAPGSRRGPAAEARRLYREIELS